MFRTLKELFKGKLVRRIVIIFSIAAIAVCICIMLPQIQRFIMHIIETKLLHRTLSNPEKWIDYLLGTGYGFSAVFALLIFLCIKKKPAGSLFLLIAVFGVYLLTYRLFSANHGEHDRLRFPFLLFLSVIVIHIAIFRSYFSNWTVHIKSVINRISGAKIIHTSGFSFACGGLLGALFFLYIFGVAILDVTYTDWLMAGGDLSQHYLGWRLFRNSDWYFPFGLMDNIVYPFKESIIYTDSIPLFALVFKAAAPLLPEQFQYFGLFGILCYILQGGLGALIVKKTGGNILHSIIGSGFFISSTVMMWRIYGHTSLSAHFIILLCILIGLHHERREFKKDVFMWSGMICLSAVIHLYFVPMITIFMFFYLLRDYLLTKNLKRQIIIMGISITLLFITMFSFGAFYSHANPSAVALGEASANLNAFFDPQGMSVFIKNMPLAAKFQYEGNSYLGLGIILAIIMISSFQLGEPNITRFKQLANRSNMFPYVLGILLSFLVFSLSPTITFNQYKIVTYPVLKPIEEIWGIFRSTGRYTWPIIYIIISFCVLWIIRKFSPQKGIVILSVLLFVQFIDLRAYFTAKGNTFKTKTVWQTELPSPMWLEIAKSYKHIFFLGEYTHLYSFLNFAANNGMTVNDAYLARKNISVIENNKQKEIADLAARAEAKSDTLYIFESQEQAERLNTDVLYLYTIDDVIIGVHSPLQTAR